MPPAVCPSLRGIPSAHLHQDPLEELLMASHSTDEQTETARLRRLPRVT